MILEEMIDDPEVYFAIQERGGGHGGKGGRSDTGAGDRAIAERTRISGVDQLRPILSHLPDALRAGGWEDSQLTAIVGADTHDDAPGRDWSLKGAVSQAEIFAKAEKPDADAAESAMHDSKTPEGAVLFEVRQGCVVATIRYISDGMATSGSQELAVELRSCGIEVSEA
jgi:hypothetical protein